MKKTLLTIGALCALASGLNAQILWNMNTATPSSNSYTPVTASAITQYNNNGTTTLLTTTSASSGYAGASGTNNAGAAARIGALNTAASGSAAFQWSITISAGSEFTLTDMSFGSRSTGTGPQAFALQYSTNAFATAGTTLATGSLAANSTWALSSPTVTDLLLTTGTTYTFRLFGYNGAGSPSASTANWRIDDLSLTGTVVAVPEPSTYAMLIAGAGVMFWTIRRKRKVS